MDYISSINHFINGIVWGPVMIAVYFGIGIFYSIKIRFYQILSFGKWWDQTFNSIFRSDNKDKSDRLTPYKAMTTSLAGTIGTGNIAGVASALTLGGAGAVFWMWVAALLGMATIYAEIYLGVLFREKKNGRFVGGPMYYLEKGVGCKFAAVFFCVCCIASSIGMGNMTQANSVSAALEEGFFIPPAATGILLSLIAGFIIIGGINRISAISEKLVPVMAIIYLTSSVIILAVNYKNIPHAFSMIITDAFDLKSAAGGFTGYGIGKAIKYGISRGVFSNEAGLGSSPVIHAAADSDSPVSEGLWGMFQVFIDTIILCTLMSLCILTTQTEPGDNNGMQLSILPFQCVFGGSGKMIISACVALFAFATLISWCYFGEKSLEYLFGDDRYTMKYRIIYIAFAFVGCNMGFSLVWEISDTLNGLMAIPNLFALVILSGRIKYKDLKRLSEHEKK